MSLPSKRLFHRLMKTSSLVMLIKKAIPLIYCVKISPSVGGRSFATTCIQQSQGSNRVRVRFAPSPTGHIHLGGLRAALYNFIFARQNGGKFVLRIEDTDQTRLLPGSADEIEDVLQWAGIAPDESPRLGGPYAPYEQSKRRDLYRNHAEQLLTHGKAYRCFCSPERLELLRKYQSRNREKTRYDGKCKRLTPSEIEQKLRATNNQHVIRFSLVEGDHSFDDMVFGRISANLVEALESDPIIMKSDGNPTYHFANVVDDHIMAISHVLRGSEWISSTPKHIQLYEAFQWQPPKYLHMPLVTMRDGSKMSKRNDHSHVKSWIDAGYQPETLFNFLTNSGGGVPKSKQDSNEFWTLDQLVKGFDFNLVTAHPATLDMNRLRVYSARELQRSWTNDRQTVIERFRGSLARHERTTDIDNSFAELVIGKLIDRLTSIDDLLSHDYAYIWSVPKLTWSVDEYRASGCRLNLLVKDIIDLVVKEDINDKDALSRHLKNLAVSHALDYGKFMQLIRKLVTNSPRGLPVHEIFTCLGRDRLIRYLESALHYVKSMNG